MKTCQEFLQILQKFQTDVQKYRFSVEVWNQKKWNVEEGQKLLVVGQNYKLHAENLRKEFLYFKEFVQLEKNYAKQIETLQFYGILDKNGGNSYIGDYVDEDYDFAQIRYEIPTLQQVKERLTDEYLKLYREMFEKGLEPELILTPIAFQIRTLFQKLEDCRNDLFTVGRHMVYQNVLHSTVEDQKIIYEVEKFELGKDGQSLVHRGGMNKAAFIQKHQGWLVSFVSMQENVSQNNQKRIFEVCAAKMMLSCVDEYVSRGYGGLGYESFLLSQMTALRQSKILGKNHLPTFLAQTTLPQTSLVAVAAWNYGSQDNSILFGGYSAARPVGSYNHSQLFRWAFTVD